MQKKYPTNFLDPLDISEYDSNSTKDSLAYAIAPLPGNDSNLLIVFYVQIMPDDFVMQLHRF